MAESEPKPAAEMWVDVLRELKELRKRIDRVEGLIGVGELTEEGIPTPDKHSMENGGTPS